MDHLHGLVKSKATTFNIAQCNTPHIQSFWITTSTFWICFFIWFENIYLIDWIMKDIHLTTTDIVLSKAMLAISALISRICIGDLLPKIGPKYCYILIMIIAAIPTCLLYVIDTSTQFILCNLFIGVAGSSFVITQYQTTQLFDLEIIGLANGTSAGWGNLGGGAAAYFGVLLATQNINWRILTLSFGLLLLIPILVNGFSTIRILDGKKKPKLTNMKSFKDATHDYRTWILFLLYAACFGVKTTVLQYITDYFSYSFNLSLLHAGLIIFIFSLLNAFSRSIGGFVSDKLHRKYGIHATTYVLFLILFMESIFLFIFALGTFDLYFSVIIMGSFGFFVESAAGVIFGIVPFINPNNIGPLYGIVGSGGNFGSFIFSISIFFFTSRHELEYKYAFIIISLFVFVVSFLALKIKFYTKKSINVRESDHLLSQISALKKEVLCLRFKTMDNIHYKEWSYKEVLTWILSLENKRFVKYEEILNKSLVDNGITGNDLCNIKNENELVEWGIHDIEDQKILFQHMEELTNPEHEGSNYHINYDGDGRRGTDYIQ